MDEAIRDLVKAHEILSELPYSVTYVGGATIPLYIDDPAARAPRATEDVDSVVRSKTYAQYARIQSDLRELGLTHARAPDDPECRWHYEGLTLDIMPSQGAFFGFENRWYEDGIEHSVTKELTDDVSIEVFSEEYLVADKIEAFRDRGNDDFYTSTDFADIIRLFDGCTDLVNKIQSADNKVKEYIVEWATNFVNRDRVHDYVSAHAPRSGRAEILIERIEEVAR